MTEEKQQEQGVPFSNKQFQLARKQLGKKVSIKTGSNAYQ